MSEQHLTGSGETVLGPFKPPLGGPSYIDLAQQHKANYFDLGDAWYSFTPTEQLAANQHVLDIAIANHDRITLSVPFYRIRIVTPQQKFGTLKLMDIREWVIMRLHHRSKGRDK
jgi:hypothetical protein